LLILCEDPELDSTICNKAYRIMWAYMKYVAEGNHQSLEKSRPSV